jgi:hypothetical protein
MAAHSGRHEGNAAPPALDDVKLDKRKTIDFAALHCKWSNETTVEQLSSFADTLGVSPESLAWLGCSWAASFNAWAFPMKSADESIVGVRLRNVPKARNGQSPAADRRCSSRTGLTTPHNW